MSKTVFLLNETDQKIGLLVMPDHIWKTLAETGNAAFVIPTPVEIPKYHEGLNRQNIVYTAMLSWDHSCDGARLWGRIPHKMDELPGFMFLPNMRYIQNQSLQRSSEA